MRGEDPEHGWPDEDAGPVVRPYTLTGGRVRPVTEDFDLVAFVQANVSSAEEADGNLQPEHRAIVAIAQEPTSVAEIAARVDLPLGVVRVLLGDLLAAGLVNIHEPSTAQFPDDDILKAVVHGLRAL
jgi:hypothetical protein